ncbi:MAG: PP2C family protein-serine/threonine phosphatase [Planctomycetota bacterium]|jgi:serine/threonine protein phosphatase PrpC
MARILQHPVRLKAPRLFIEADLDDVEMHQFATGEVCVFTRRAPGKDTVSEDAAALIPTGEDSGVAVVADGVGGLPQGASASRLVVRTVSEAVQAAAQTDSGLRSAILDGLEEANRLLIESGTGAATTVAVAEIRGNTVRSYHIGDSIILVAGQRGRIKHRNVPHSPTGYGVASGLLDRKEAMHHEERHIVSNLLGFPGMRIEIGPPLELARRDTLVIASDGLPDNLYPKEIVELIRKGALRRLGRRLFKACTERMHLFDEVEGLGDTPSHPDDLSFMVFRRSA